VVRALAAVPVGVVERQPALRLQRHHRHVAHARACGGVAWQEARQAGHLWLHGGKEQQGLTCRQRIRSQDGYSYSHSHSCSCSGCYPPSGAYHQGASWKP
jgi:hypothetical protein